MKNASFWKDKVFPRMANLVLNDFWRKIFSLLFAVLLTAYAHLVVKMKMDMVKIHLRDVPVYFVPADGENFSIVPWDVSLTVDIDVEVPSGMKNVKNADFYVECPMTKAQIDTDDPKPLKLNRDFVKTRRPIDNLNVQAIRPDVIRPDLDYYLEKDVPVYPTYIPKEVMAGYDVHVPDVGKLVRIRGPKRHLESIYNLETEKIPISNAFEGFTCLVRPVLPNSMRDDSIKILSDTVMVDVQIKRKELNTIKDVPIRVLTGKEGPNNLVVVSIKPETVTVEFDYKPPPQVKTKSEMQSSANREVSASEIHPFLDLSDLTQPGVYSVDIRCWSENETVREVRVNPKQATVTLESPAPPPKEDPVPAATAPDQEQSPQ